MTLVHSLPGRVRVRVPGLCGRKEACAFLELRLAAEQGIDRVEARRENGSVTISYDPTVHTQARVLQLVARRLPQAQNGKPGHAEIARIRDIPAHRPTRLSPLALPTLALAVTTLEAAPAALVAAALCVASMRIASRAAEGARARQFNVDQLDAANVLLTALQGDPVAAGAITWLVGLQELIRGRSLRGAREKALKTAMRAIPGNSPRIVQDRKALIDLTDGVPLSDTYVQNRASGVADRLDKPFLALAALRFTLTRQPQVIIDTIKPHSDFQSGVRYAGPTSVIAGICAAYEGGALPLSGKALEKLARVNALVIDLHGHPAEAPLRKATEELKHLGIEREVFLGPSGEVKRGQRTNSLREGESLVRQMRKQGWRVGVVGLPRTAPELYAVADLSVCIGPPRAEPDLFDLALVTHDPMSLCRAIRAARLAVRGHQQNTAIIALAACFNLAASFLGGLPAPLGTAATTTAIALLSSNARRVQLYA